MAHLLHLKTRKYWPIGQETEAELPIFGKVQARVLGFSSPRPSEASDHPGYVTLRVGVSVQDYPASVIGCCVTQDRVNFTARDRR